MIKKFIKPILHIVLIVCLTLSLAYAQGIDVWHPYDEGNTFTLAWDEPAAYENGDPLPADGVLSYELYVKDHPDGLVETTISNRITFQQGDPIQHDVSVTRSIFPNSGQYIIGIRAFLQEVGDPLPDEKPSAYCWSDSSDCCAESNTFGLEITVAVNLIGPDGIRILEQSS